MTVTKDPSTNSRYFSLTGTMAEVIDALDVEGVTGNQIVEIFYNGTNITAVYRR